MKLSIVIVNYNVCYFLEQCLQSVFVALRGIDGEVFVVDNNSVDNSVEMIKDKFEAVKLIVNKENVGFAKANNQAIKIASGEYVLLLNPDTVVEADTFEKTIRFMEQTPDCGALGVKMVDGKGVFLPESKRSLPIPSVAFYKIFGLAKVFKKSKRFGKYHLTYLDENQINTVDVLSGAFMLIRKSTLNKVGLLDEDYFMYGEDIDLSYRITQGGYKNYYYPQTRIIHYKGESTKKSSINYVFVFYKAMQIFAKKHFSQKNAFLFNTLINIAIWLRASFAVCQRLLLKIIVPLLDFLFIYGGLLLIAFYWQNHILLDRNSSFAPFYLFVVLPIYALIWVLSIYFSKGYKKPIFSTKVNSGVIIGTVIILLSYALLSEEYRFSRAVVLLGTTWVFIITGFFRFVLGKLNLKNYPIGEKHNRRIIIIGDSQEVKRVAVLLSGNKNEFIGFVHPDNSQPAPKDFVGTMHQLKDIITIYQIGEVIFCGKNFSAKEIISIMNTMKNNGLEYKIAPDETSYVIGSNTINIYEDIYTMDINSIGKKENKTKKRFLDIALSLFLLLTFVLNCWWVEKKANYFLNCWKCLFGKKTWVGYCQQGQDIADLPQLKQGVIDPSNQLNLEQPNSNILMQINNLYAKNYKMLGDLKIIFGSFYLLGK